MNTIKFIIFLNLLLLWTSCDGQNKTDSKLDLNEIVNFSKLKNKVLYTSVKRNGGSIVQEYNVNGFSDDIYIHFLDKDNVELKYFKYSPSIGGRETIIKGTYQIKAKNKISLNLIEPKGVSVSYGGKEIQYSLDMFNSVNNNRSFTDSVIEKLPFIKIYNFNITNKLNEKCFESELVLIDTNGIEHKFGEYKFEITNEKTE